MLVSTSNKISTDICAKQIGSGVVVFFALVGVFGLILHCSTSPSSNNDFPCFARSSNRRSDSSDDDDDDDFAVVVIIVIIFAIIGIVYAFIAATIAVQRIFQRHYHILAKKELTKVTWLDALIYPHHLAQASLTSSLFGVQEYVVEDLRGGYTPPKLDLEHEQRLKKLQLM